MFGEPSYDSRVAARGLCYCAPTLPPCEAEDDMALDRLLEGDLAVANGTPLLRVTKAPAIFSQWSTAAHPDSGRGKDSHTHFDNSLGGSDFLSITSPDMLCRRRVISSDAKRMASKDRTASCDGSQESRG